MPPGRFGFRASDGNAPDFVVSFIFLPVLTNTEIITNAVRYGYNSVGEMSLISNNIIVISYCYNRVEVLT